jgi:hypothetical protein
MILIAMATCRYVFSDISDVGSTEENGMGPGIGGRYEGIASVAVRDCVRLGVRD